MRTDVCLWCGGVDHEPFWTDIEDRLDHVAGTWNYRRCLTCDSLQLDPLPDREDLHTFYPERYGPQLPEPANASVRRSSRQRTGKLAVSDHEGSDEKLGWLGLKQWADRLERRFFFGLTYRLQTRRLMRAMEQDGRGIDGGKHRLSILDLGCGGGFRLVEYRKHGFKVQGVDFQPEAVQHACQRLGVPARHLDAHQIGTQWPAESFDIISAYYLFEHLPDIASLVTTCKSLLRPGGSLAFAVPLADSWQAKFWGRRWSQVTEAPRHLSLPTQSGISKLLRDCGFENPVVLGENSFGCSAMAALSLIPVAAATYRDRRSTIRYLANRFTGAVAAACWLPWTWIECNLTRHPAAGIVITRKPSLDKTR